MRRILTDEQDSCPPVAHTYSSRKPYASQPLETENTPWSKCRLLPVAPFTHVFVDGCRANRTFGCVSSLHHHTQTHPLACDVRRRRANNNDTPATSWVVVRHVSRSTSSVLDRLASSVTMNATQQPDESPRKTPHSRRKDVGQYPHGARRRRLLT